MADQTEATVEQIQPPIEPTINKSMDDETPALTEEMKGSIEENKEKNVECSDADGENSLEYAQEMMKKGSEASKLGDYVEAVDCFSRALEIRAAHYGELATECVESYYKYGRALLYKAQDEADPLGAMLKKGAQSKQDSDKAGLDKDSTVAGSSIPSNAEDGSSKPPEEVANDDNDGKDVDEDEEGSDVEDTAEADEEDSDLDLAWKMLDVARAIVEKQPGETMEKVDILSTLAEVALEREDVETSLGDYLKALSILETLMEPDSRHIAELNFRICLCLEIGSKSEEAIPYCEKAIATCKSRVQRLTDEAKSVDSVADNGDEIETLKGLSDELEKKLEDLQQLASNPTSILADILGSMAAKAKGNEEGAPSINSPLQMGAAQSSGTFESSVVSTANTNGASAVTHLGVVGRGAKRVLLNTVETESNAAKKPAP